MPEYFEIRPSRAQLGLLIAGHLLLAVTVAVYVEPATLRLPVIALILLLGFRESARELRQGKLVLYCDPRAGKVAIQYGEQPYFCGKNKVYATRWFAILKLTDNGKSRTLILNSDRFESASNYHRLRYLLRCLEQSRAA